MPNYDYDPIAAGDAPVVDRNIGPVSGHHTEVRIFDLGDGDVRLYVRACYRTHSGDWRELNFDSVAEAEAYIAEGERCPA